MKSKTKCLCYIALSLLIIVWFLYSLKEGKTLLETTKGINYLYFIHQFIFIFFANIINSYLNVSLIQHFGLKLSWKEWLPLGFVNSLANLIFPAKTGTMIKAIYLKKKYNFAITKNFSLLFFITFITYLNLFFTTGIFLLFLRVSNNKDMNVADNLLSVPSFDLFVLSMFVITTIGTIVLLLLKFVKPYEYPFQGAAKKFMNVALSLIEGSVELSSNQIVIVKIFICTSLSYFIRFGMLYWGFLAVNTQLNFFQLIFINLFFSLQSIVNFLPGNIGVQEIIITISSGVIGANFSDGLIVAGIIRLTSLIEIFLFGFISFNFLKINAFLYQKELPKNKQPEL